MDWSQFSTVAEHAVIIIAVFSALGYAAIEFIKAGLKSLTLFQLPPEAASFLAGLIAIVFTIVQLKSEGQPWIVAVIAALVAAQGPKVVHDATARLTP